ncbi:MAG: galactose oxidase-like domain-containing protein [Isosphaeraceae bacterium]
MLSADVVPSSDFDRMPRPLSEVKHQTGSGTIKVNPHFSELSQPNKARAVRLRHHPAPAPPPNPAVAGSWTPAVPFKPPGAKQPYIAIHMSVLPNGDVLAWPHDYNYFLRTHHAAPYTPGIMLWNPTTNQYVPLPVLKSNIFCSGSTFLPNGDLIVLGGHGPAAIPVSGLQTHYGNDHAEIFDFRTDTWYAGPNMGEGRYYGSAITLGDGQVITVAGYNEDGGNNPTIQLYTQGQGWQTLSTATTEYWPEWYPNIYQLSNGLVFAANPGRSTYLIDPTGTGSIWAGPPMNYPRRYEGTSVMYAQDQIISIGGDSAPGQPPTGGTSRQITNTAEIINLDSPNPTWQYTGSMHFSREYANATLLPDGTVLVTGGTSQQDDNNGNALRGAVYAAELWNPSTGQWSLMSSMSVPRLYHSTAILLPDARVLVAGGGEPESTGEANGTTHQNMQIFSPPYLFRGPQPVIGSAPASASYGQTIPVTSPDAASITKINLIRNGSVTHSFNMTQKIVSVSFDRAADGTLELHMPTNPNDAPPGPYMIFLLNSLGVPSKAAMMMLG